MHTDLDGTLAESLAYLRSLSRDRVPPKDARRRLRDLQEHHPGIPMDLVWQEESFDHSFHYDMMLELNGEGNSEDGGDANGTVTLGFCPDRGMPWPMRGVQRWTDRDLVRVNETVLHVGQAIACMDFIWGESRIVDRLVNVCLIQEALEEEPVELSENELQRAMDAFRRAKRLYSAADTRRWLESRGLSHEQFESLVVDQAKIARLRERVAADGVDDYFAENRETLDRMVLAHIDYASEPEAARASACIAQGAAAFHELVEQRFRHGELDPGTASPWFQVYWRDELPAALGRALHRASRGDVVGPISLDDAFVLVRVVRVEPAKLDRQTRDRIEQTLFDRWLAERREKAAIEWFWGNLQTT